MLIYLKDDISIYDKAAKYMEIFFYIEGALTTYEMILKVGYLELNEKTS